MHVYIPLISPRDVPPRVLTFFHSDFLASHPSKAAACSCRPFPSRVGLPQDLSLTTRISVAWRDMFQVRQSLVKCNHLNLDYFESRRNWMKLVDSRTTNGLRKSTKVRTLEDIPSLVSTYRPLITKRPWECKMTDPDPTTKSWGSNATNIKKSLFRGINSEWTPNDCCITKKRRECKKSDRWIPHKRLSTRSNNLVDGFNPSEKIFQTTNQQPMTI